MLINGDDFLITCDVYAYGTKMSASLNLNGTTTQTCTTSEIKIPKRVQHTTKTISFQVFMLQTAGLPKWKSYIVLEIKRTQIKINVKLNTTIIFVLQRARWTLRTASWVF